MHNCRRTIFIQIRRKELTKTLIYDNFKLKLEKEFPNCCFNIDPQSSMLAQHWNRHRIRNSRSGGLRLSTPPLGHIVSQKEAFVCLKSECQSGKTNPRSPTFQAGSYDHCTRVPTLVMVIKFYTSVHHPPNIYVHQISEQLQKWSWPLKKWLQPVISATTKVILTIKEVITATLKMI